MCIAKTPVPGRVKTRLSPPCLAEEAARLADASLADTLNALRQASADRRVLFVEGDLPAQLAAGFEVVPQATGDLAERLAAAFAAVEGPAVIVGMDTPQVTPALLERAATTLRRPGVDAVLGPATDGGYWAIGLREPRPDVFAGVPMSTSRTARAQRGRLRELGLLWFELPMLRDVDRMEDARAVAALAPGTSFAATFAEIERAVLSRR